jgi:hypothetical protein
VSFKSSPVALLYDITVLFMDVGPGKWEPSGDLYPHVYCKLYQNSPWKGTSWKNA